MLKEPRWNRVSTLDLFFLSFSIGPYYVADEALTHLLLLSSCLSKKEEDENSLTIGNGRKEGVAFTSFKVLAFSSCRENNWITDLFVWGE